MKKEPKLAHFKRETVNSFQQFLSGGRFPAYPLEVFLEVSNVCNMKCAMCSVFSELNPKRLFALKSSERGFLPDRHFHALGPLLSHALLVHCYGYGEPTIHPRFAELLDFLIDKEVLVDFFTNGMKLTEELCSFLAERKVFRVTVSFSGASKEDYENMYLDGNYETVLAGLERMAQLKATQGSLYPSIEINSIAFQHHIDHLPTFVEQMAARGVDVIHLKPLHAYGALPALHLHTAVMRPWHEGKLIEEAKRRARKHGIGFVDEFSNVAAVDSPEQELEVRKQLLWGAEEVSGVALPLAEFKSLARSVKPVPPPKRNEGLLKPETAMDQTQKTIRPFLKVRPLEKPPANMCYEPFKTFYVNQQGGVRPCCFGFTQTHLGNLDAHPAKRIWNGIGFNKVRRVITNGRYPMNICKACLQQKSYPKQHNFHGMLGAYTRWFGDVFGQAFTSEASFFAQLFVDTGLGFSEAQSVVKPLSLDVTSDSDLEFDVGGFRVIKALRFDPINSPARVSIAQAYVIDDRGRKQVLCFSPINGSAATETELLFSSDDPQIRLAGFPAVGCRTIRLSLSYSIETPP